MAYTHDTDLGNELAKQGHNYGLATIPDPEHRAPRYWARWNSGTWVPLAPREGSQAIRRDEAVHRAILDAEEHDADAVEVAVRPVDEAVFYAEGLPPRKGTQKRDALMLTPYRPTRITFRSIARTLWAIGRTGGRYHDLAEIAPNGGVGPLIWERPRSLQIELPPELDGAAPDRVKHWEAIAARLVGEALENTLAGDVDVVKLSKAAAKEHHATWRDAPLPELVTKWSEPEQAAYVETHERLCRGGMGRFAQAPQHAIKMIAERVAAEIIAGTRAI